MKAAVARNWGEAFVIEDRPTPEPKRGEAVLNYAPAALASRYSICEAAGSADQRLELWAMS